MAFVNAINEIHDNIWAILIMLGGCILSHWDKTTGEILITLGAAVFQKRIATPNGNGH